MLTCCTQALDAVVMVCATAQQIEEILHTMYLTPPVSGTVWHLEEWTSQPLQGLLYAQDKRCFILMAEQNNMRILWFDSHSDSISTDLALLIL